MKGWLLIGFIAAFLATSIFLSPRIQVALRTASTAKLSDLETRAQASDLAALKILSSKVKGQDGVNAIVVLARVATNLEPQLIRSYVIPAFVDALTSNSPATRRQAALSSDALVGGYPAELLPALSNMATNEGPAQAHLAIEAIARAKEHSAHPLIAIARHYQASTFMPGGGFDYLAPKAVAFKELSTAAPLLVEAQTLFRGGLRDPNPYVQLWSSVGIFKGGTRELAESKFMELLNSRNEDFLYHAKPALRELPGLSANIRQNVQFSDAEL